MKQRFTITGMTCSACSARIERVAGSIPGVRSAAVNLLAGRLDVDYDEAVATPHQIMEAIIAEGYGAELAQAGAQKRRNAAQEQALRAMKTRLRVSVVFLLLLMYVSMGI